MGSHLLLDLSELFTLRDEEPGAGRAEEALELVGSCSACFLSRMEMVFRVWKDEDERASLTNEQLKSRPCIGWRLQSPYSSKPPALRPAIPSRWLMPGSRQSPSRWAPPYCIWILNFVPSPICRRNGSVDRPRGLSVSCEDPCQHLGSA
jgi:hypothetical protein